VPKTHYFYHLVDFAAIANPFKLRCYNNESFVGFCARIYKRSMTGTWQPPAPQTQHSGPTVAPAALRRSGPDVDGILDFDACAQTRSPHTGESCRRQRNLPRATPATLQLSDPDIDGIFDFHSHRHEGYKTPGTALVVEHIFWQDIRGNWAPGESSWWHRVGCAANYPQADPNPHQLTSRGMNSHQSAAKRPGRPQLTSHVALFRINAVTA
jgi:hypothetical protein